MMSSQGQSVPDFQREGFDAMDPKWDGGRPPAISPEVREPICLIARTVTAEWGITGHFTWGLRTLAGHLIGPGRDGGDQP